ncbi:MAG TPA: APC family permease [Longimicrobium sp.]|jgi:amino acid transporter|nr:APC family permease [Longimicrobium sp.]
MSTGTQTKLRRVVLGKPRNVRDPQTYHNISLVALLAWVGLGADGLSSSAYGPDEAFRALGPHAYLAVALAAATAMTVLVISVAYSQIIRRFPFGGGGYVVASELLGPRWGLVSGAALLVDYVLTISVSIAAGADQVFSVLPPAWHGAKLVATALVILLLVGLNLRGVKESVTVLAPIFGLFLLTHLVLIVGGLATHAGQVPRVAAEVSDGFRAGLGTLGWLGMFAVFLRAYSMGAGTYTGIEAVSNGLQIMREPKVRTASRTMVYMALSLAVTAGGILVLYLLFHTTPQPGKTMNAVLLESFAGGWKVGGVRIGYGFVAFALAMEAALLFVAAQAGFIDGPRVMSNMAMDSWLPHRFAQLSDRLTIQDGVLLMGAAALATLVYTQGDITRLVTMYSINVFATFSLSQLGMVRYWLRRRERGRGRGLAIHGVALALCGGILGGVLYEKLGIGGWVTVAVTGAVVGICLLVRRHYDGVREGFRRLDEVMSGLPAAYDGEPKPLDPRAPTAVLLVGGYGGLGIHALLSVQRLFPGHFRNFLFVSVGVIDAAAMKGIDEVDRVRERTETALRHYVELARKLGLPADYRMDVGTEAVAGAERLAAEIAREFPRSIFFMGKLIFAREGWFYRVLHNNTADQLQRRLQFAGINAMLLPVRALDLPRAA